MAKNSKHKLLFTTIMLTLLMVSIAYAVLIPSANAEETNLQQKGLSILSNVAGFDLTKYNIAIKEYPQDNSTYRNVVPQIHVAYDLTSDDSTLKALFTFANGNLQMIHVLENEGVPNLIETKTGVNDLELAQGFLRNYQTYTNNPLYGELELTLDNVDNAKNLTKTMGNKVLDVTINNGYTSFKWYFTSNGVAAQYSKFISLVFKDGFLVGFVDNWQLYDVGSTTINLSKEEAIAIALDAAKDHAYSKKLDAYSFDANNINESNVRFTSLHFDGSITANKKRSEDVLELYPVWRIGVALDKWYGQMYGIEVEIWVDTKEIRSIQEAWSTLPPPEGAPTAEVTTVQKSANQNSKVAELNPNMILLIALPTFATAITGGALTYMLRKKKTRASSLLKKRSFKALGILICTFMLSGMLLASIATVTADTKTAVIWGSESSEAYDPDPQWDPHFNWRKSKPERTFQQQISGTLENYFQYGGYTAQNNQGTQNSGSSRDQIIDDIQTYSDSSSRVAFIDFDHGNGHDINGEFHFMFEDQKGTGVGTWESHEFDYDNAVFDRDVYWYGNSGKTLLAFINTCNSASLVRLDNGEPWQGYGTQGPIGLPYAFTRGRMVVDKEQTSGFNIEDHMSDDAYFYPDDGHQVFIGFVMGSASLEQKLPHYGGTRLYHEWVERFFYYALHYDMSVNDALDHASYIIWGDYFFEPDVPLRDFTSYWWNGVPSPTGPGSMAVYGNGRIHLKSFGDNFNDGNYNGWTVTQGSWTAGIGKLRSLQGYSRIRTNQVFTNDIHLRVKVRTISAGTNSWDVAWVMAKYVDTNNMIYGLIHKNGQVELAVIKNGQKQMWKTGTSTLDPYNTNTIDVNIVDNKGWVWVNHDLKLTVTNSWLDDFSGYAALYTHTSSTAEFDDITVIRQSDWPTYHKLIISTVGSGDTDPSAGPHNYEENTYAYVTADPDPGHVLDYWELDGEPAGSYSTKSVYMNQFHTLEANFRPALYYDLTISSSSGGSTDPSPGTYEDIMEGTPFTVTADPDDYHIFDHWDLDGEPAGSNPTIIVTMNKDYTLHANFVYEPDYNYVSSINDYNEYVNTPENLVGLNPDGFYAGLAGAGPYGVYGWIEAGMDSQATGHIYMYGYAGSAGHLYVYVSSNGYNWNLVSSPYVSSSSPYWIDCGTYTGTFNYIKVTVEHPSEWPILYIDSVRVEP